MRARISVRIDELLRQRMRSIRINWSEYIREAVKAKLHEEELKRRIDEVNEITEASTGV